MHDTTWRLRVCCSGLRREVQAALVGHAIVRWHNVEFSRARGLRVDLLGETADGRLIHIELQSTNDPDMALRMAEYALAIFRQFRRWPVQIVLYVGAAPLRMASGIDSDAVSFRYNVVDFQELDAEPL